MSDMPNTQPERIEGADGAVTSPLPLNPHSAREQSSGTRAARRDRRETPRHGRHSAGGGEPRPSRGRKGVAALAVFCCLILAAYGAGVAIFSRTCYPGTFVADADLSWLDRDSSIARVKDAAEDYALRIEGDGFSWSYEAEQASDVIDAAAAVDRVIARNEPFLWPVHLVQRLATPLRASDGKNSAQQVLDANPGVEDIALPPSFDRDAFLSELNASIDEFNAGRTGTFDAPSSYDAEAKRFTLEKALSNRKLDAEAIDRAALMAVSALNSRIELTDSAYVPLANGADEQRLQKALEAASEIAKVDVNLKMGGATVATVDGATIAPWITFDEALEPSLSTEPLTQWVRDLASTQLDTVGSKRTYTRPDGKSVTVQGGTYGWVSNEAELVKLLQNAITGKQTGDIEIPVKRSGATWGGAGNPDWGAYCDIDLSEQHARYYDAAGNLVWESGCITGNPNKGNATPTGIYALNAKTRDATLIGADEDDDGEPDYRTPVAYWMPFVGTSIGLHDAGWQSASSFSNPRAYTWTGSHGCINLPPERAEALFNVISKGDCVIVHN